MNHSLNQSHPRSAQSVSSHHSPRRLSHVLKRCLILFIALIITLALLSGVLLLTFDFFQPFLHNLVHAPISAAPLLLIGLAFLSFQLLIRPKPLELLKAFIVSAAFILWGVVQLLPVGWIATMLGDVVIVLYVVDLGWMMLDRLTHQGWLKQTLPAAVTHPLQTTPLPPPNWKGIETEKSAPVHISTPIPQRLYRSSLEVQAQNTPRMRPIHLKAFQDSSLTETAPTDTTPHHICSDCGKPRAYACC